MLMLRLDRGIELIPFERKTGQDPLVLFADQLEHLRRARLVEVSHTSIRLAPSGIQVADAIAAEFLEIADWPSNATASATV